MIKAALTIVFLLIIVSKKNKGTTWFLIIHATCLLVDGAIKTGKDAASITYDVIIVDDFVNSVMHMLLKTDSNVKFYNNMILPHTILVLFVATSFVLSGIIRHAFFSL